MKQGTSTFSGWGISLCWWANIEYPESIKKLLIELLFGKSGLGLNVARYNLGGGSNPDQKQNFRLGADMPCIMDTSGDFNLENDRLQLDILNRAVEAGVDKVEIFCNSPPYFMTKSGFTNGSNRSWDCNLKPDYIDKFVDFLDKSYEILIKRFPIASINPFNEPSNPFWTTSINQEGCFYDYKTRRQIIKRLKDKNPKIVISNGDESSSFFGLLWYIFSPKNLIDRINVHGYNYVEWRGIHFNFFDYTIWRRILRYFYNGDLWMSEYGFGYDDTISDSLRLARNIFRDLDTLRPDVWVYWQVEHITSSWGLLKIDFENPNRIEIQKQYWVFKHFAKTLRPGDKYRLISKNVLRIDNGTQIKYIILNDSIKKINSVDLGLDFQSYYTLESCHLSKDGDVYVEIQSLPKLILPNSILSVVYNKGILK